MSKDNLVGKECIIRVDRSVRSSYPDWVKTVMYPELETTGPTEYDINKVEQWLHDEQRNGKWIEGYEIYAFLKETDALKTCLGLRDLEEIQKKDITSFRKYLQGNNVIFGWKSVAMDNDGRLVVPFLHERSGKAVVDWNWLGVEWGGHDPAFRFINE